MTRIQPRCVSIFCKYIYSFYKQKIFLQNGILIKTEYYKIYESIYGIIAPLFIRYPYFYYQFLYSRIFRISMSSFLKDSSTLT